MESTSKSPYKPVIHPHNKSSEIKVRIVFCEIATFTFKIRAFDDFSRMSISLKEGNLLWNYPRILAVADENLQPALNWVMICTLDLDEVPLQALKFLQVLTGRGENRPLT